jgi:hypothetical protein
MRRVEVAGESSSDDDAAVPPPHGHVPPPPAPTAAGAMRGRCVCATLCGLPLAEGFLASCLLAAFEGVLLVSLGTLHVMSYRGGEPIALWHGTDADGRAALLTVPPATVLARGVCAVIAGGLALVVGLGSLWIVAWRGAMRVAMACFR